MFPVKLALRRRRCSALRAGIRFRRWAAERLDETGRKTKATAKPLFNLCSQVFVTVTGVKLVGQTPMMKWVKCNEFYLAH